MLHNNKQSDKIVIKSKQYSTKYIRFSGNNTFLFSVKHSIAKMYKITRAKFLYKYFYKILGSKNVTTVVTLV